MPSLVELHLVCVASPIFRYIVQPVHGRRLASLTHLTLLGFGILPRDFQAMVAEMPLHDTRYNISRESPVVVRDFEGLSRLRKLSIRYEDLRPDELSDMLS
ncbi:hypothetical protein BV25DRAFT_1040029 [Artomyces pyxidatus]|uniref:Uncharacterized protein n=1 Tax=Artomyces pyxidatus TaxID=48021 RepID=A0ACB8ST32_9AGAM|nr:hypothetical protein BV25DRAFT_1040029 [Artomyces pyxidatus]